MALKVGLIKAGTFVKMLLYGEFICLYGEYLTEVWLLQKLFLIQHSESVIRLTVQ